MRGYVLRADDDWPLPAARSTPSQRRADPAFPQARGGPLTVRTDETPITPATETGYSPDPRLRGIEGEDEGEDEDSASEADAFDTFRAKGKKHRNAVLALALARSLKYSNRNTVFAKVEAETKANIRQVWTPTAENVLARVSADYLDALHLGLTRCEPQGNGFKAFKSQKKGEKAAAMERLFADPDYQAAWKIDAEKEDPHCGMGAGLLLIR